MSADSISSDNRVLIAAPTGADATNIGAVLRRAGQDTVLCPNLSAVASEVGRGCGAVVLTEEALNDDRYTDLSGAFDRQPPWSSIPLVLVVSGGKTAIFREEIARFIGQRSSLSLVERPVRAATLVSTVQSALQARRQQYQTRELLRERDALLASLEQKVEERTVRLRELNSELEAFCYSVSHDLRAPLRSMESYARILCDDYAEALPAEGKQFAQRIVKNAEKMDRLMQDVLAISRLNREQMRIEAIDLDEVVADVIEQYPDLASRRQHIVVRAPLGVVAGHAPSLVQCFSNLLQNALKFVPRERTPEVRIFSESMGDHLRVRICDNGVGIDPRHHARIFAIFERVAPADVPGTGVGLAIVKKAIHRMGGTVGVESKLGEGACFWIELPLAPALAERQAACA